MNPLRNRLSWSALLTGALFVFAACLGYHLGGTRPPAIELGHRGGPELRVAHRTRAKLELSLRGPWAIERRAPDSDAFQPWRRSIGDTGWTMTAEASGLAVAGDGIAANLDGTLRVRAAAIRDRDAPVWGTLEVRADRGKLVAVAVIDMETYLLGVVGSEMGSKFPLEALKAQAVAARSYAFARLTKRSSRSRVLAPTTVDQVFRPSERIPESISRAVDETRGEILGSSSAPIKAYFHSTCGGSSRNAAPHFDPLSPILGASCSWCRTSKYHSWFRTYTYRQITRALEASGRRLNGPVTSVTVSRTCPAGRALAFAVRDRRRVIEVPGLGFRAALNRQASGDRSRQLLSTYVTVETTIDGRGIAIKGHGWGHGVGMCQIGAAGLARTGADYRAILGHYYPSLPVRRAWSIADAPAP